MSSAAAPSIRHWQICGGSGSNPISGGAHESYDLLGTVDTTIELEVDVGYCIIFKAGNTGDMQSAGDFQLQYEKNSTGGFVDVNATSSNLRTVATGDTEDATSTTERLGTSSETFINSVLDEVEGLIAANLAGHEELELYFAFEIRSADTTGGDTFELRITTGGATFDHTAVEPIDVTIPVGITNIDATPDLAFAVPTADLEGKGKLDATPDPQVVFAAATVDLEAKGKLDASSDLVLAVVAADLKAKGKLDATPDPHLVFALATADLTSDGKLDATPDMTFGVAVASLIDITSSAFPYHLFRKRRDMRALLTL